MAERTHGDRAKMRGGAVVERHGEAPGPAPGKRSMVETTFGDGARAPSEPGQTSLDQQLQRKQGQAGATNSDATTTALEVTEAQPGRTSSSQPHTAGVPPPMFEQGVEWEKIPSDEYAVAG